MFALLPGTPAGNTASPVTRRSFRRAVPTLGLLALLLATVVPRTTLADDKSPASTSESAARLPRVLLIGDSISLGYTKHVVELLKGRAEVRHNPGNAGNTGRSLERMPKWLAAENGRWDVIHFNWGLWDLCYRNPEAKTKGRRDKVHGKVTHTPEEYRQNLEKLVAMLQQTGATLIWASTTPVPEGEAGRKVGDDVTYNRIAAEVMRKHGIPINDLHALMVPHMKTRTTAPGNVHFTPEGSQILARQVAARITQALEN